MERMDGASLTNPNLKPEKITNYELGFQQVLSESSALTISAYYKQTRDLIALVQYTGADPTTMYYSYDNQDFRTTKGLTIAYDLRRLKMFVSMQITHCSMLRVQQVCLLQHWFL